MANADRIIDLFHEAKSRPAGPERDQFIADHCQDLEERDQVLALLGAQEEVGDFLDAKPQFSSEIEAKLAQVKAEVSGDRIGPYKLREQIGEGGFGVVWVAEQYLPVRRTVALKIIKLGMDTKEVVARFEQERQALAMMDHPNIAKVFDAGATDHGRPYFVMEVVRGIKITDYCDQANLPTTERLALLIQVCLAVQHAHQKGIIHRDLKPSNILVTLHDGVPVPKVIDFGVAKATQGRLGDLSIYTRLEQMIGTPLYMSPEQAEMSGLDIDTRTDIYALGVLLYELLTGRTPFDAAAFTKAGHDEMRRIIREQEPPKPSTALDTMEHATLTTVAQHRDSEPPKLIHAIRGDLDWIVMKCLEKDRARRYETANGLAADLKRHLANEPVDARPPSRVYQFRKLVRRNKLAFAATAAIFCALVLGIVASTLQLVRARRAEREQSRLREVAEGEKTRAQNESIKSEQVARFLTSVFTGADPFASTARDRTLLIEIVDRASTRIDGDLAGQPAVQAELKRVMGSVYDMIGEYEKSERLHRESLATMRNLGGTSDSQLATSIEVLSDVLRRRGANEESESLLRECLSIRRKIDPRDREEIAWTLRNLAWALTAQGKGKEAEAITREGLDMRRKLHGNAHRLVADSLWGLAANLESQNRLAEAESVGRQAIAMCESIGSTDDIKFSLIIGSVAHILGQRGKTGEAIELERKSMTMREKFLGFHHPWTSGTRYYLLELLELQREYEEAETLLRKQLAEVRALGPDRSSKLGKALYSLANILRKRTKLIEARALAEEANALYNTHPEWTGSERHTASRVNTEVLAEIGELAALEALHRKNLETIRASLPVDHSQLAVALASLSRTLLPVNKFTEAEPFAREGLDLLAKQTSENWITFDAQSILGGSLLGQKKYAEAEPLLLSAYEGLKALEDKIPLDDKVRRTEAVQRIVQFYQATGQSEKGAEWSKTLTDAQAAIGSRDEALKLREELLALRRKLLSPEHPDTIQTMLTLADFHSSAGNLDDTLKLREEALPLCRSAFGSGHANTLRAMERLADSKLQAGRWTEALTLLEDASTQKSQNTFLALKLATLQVWFEKEADHAATTQRLFKWASETTDHEAAERVAKLTCLRPIEDASVRTAALAFARRAVELGNGKDSFLPYAHMVLGMAEYRSGHYPAADSALIEAAKTSSVGGGRSVANTSCFYRVMSLFKQGRQSEARDLFTTTQAKMKPLPVDEQKPLSDGKSSSDDLILWLAYKEARALLKIFHSK